MKEIIYKEDAINAILANPPEPHYPQWYADRIKKVKPVCYITTPSFIEAETAFIIKVFMEDGTMDSWSNWDDYEVTKSNLFVIKNKGMWIGIYNLPFIKNIKVIKKENRTDGREYERTD